MSQPKKAKKHVPRIEYLRVRNYRALQDLELRDLTPLTVFLGPNGSGKSTIFDVFAFLSECFTSGLRKAWDKRGRLRELRTRGQDGPLTIEIKYREQPKSPIITYHLAIDEEDHAPIIAEEWLQWKRKSYGQPFRFLDFRRGIGKVVSGETPDDEAKRDDEELESAEFLAVNTLGQFSKHPRVSALRRFIVSWYLSYLSAEKAKEIPEAGPQEKLSATGDNLPNVIQFLQERHPSRLTRIFEVLSQRVPRLERVDSNLLADGRLLLQIKDAPFERPILAKYASDGTLKMLAYLTVLYDPEPAELVGIEEPENFLHPSLLPELAEECRSAASRTQLMVTTHSPFFVNGLRPSELWALYRDKTGFTRAVRASDMPNVDIMVKSGGQLGHLWMEKYLTAGYPNHKENPLSKRIN